MILLYNRACPSTVTIFIFIEKATVIYLYIAVLVFIDFFINGKHLINKGDTLSS